MKRLIKHEFFKVLRSKTLMVAMIIAASLAALQALLLLAVKAVVESDPSLMILPTAGSASMSVVVGDTTLPILFAIVLSSVVCGEMRNKTIKITALADFSRGEIYAAKCLAIAAVSALMLAVYSLIYVSVSLMIFGWGPDLTFGSVLMNIFVAFLMGLLLCWSACAMLNFFAYLTKNTALVIVIAVIVFQVLIGIVALIAELSSSTFFETLYKFSYDSVVANFIRQKSLENFAYYIVPVLISLTGFTAGGYFLFRKQEIK